VDLIQAVVYGIVQGLTEWLPISSTAHLRILPSLFGWQDPGAGFTAVIQLGTILAVLIYFRNDLGRAISAWARSLTGKGRETPDAKLGWGVFWGSIPIIVIGFLFRDLIKSDQARSLYVVSATLIGMGLIMLVAERVGSQKRKMEDITVRDGVAVGLWQALALIPGMSRSGSTISGALFQGLDRATAARFSFLLSVPSILGAGLFELYEERHGLMEVGITSVLVATLVSFAVGYASIAFLIKWLQKRGIGAFILYRIVLGILLLVLVQQGVIRATEDNPDTAPVAGSSS
jgi:undecaprenyl-diphosphatase